MGKTFSGIKLPMLEILHRIGIIDQPREGICQVTYSKSWEDLSVGKSQLNTT